MLLPGSNIIAQNEPEVIVIDARDSTGAGVTGATVTLALKRYVDGWWWNGTGFQSAFVANTMTEVDATNLAGIYAYKLTPTFGDCTLILRATSATAAVANEPWYGVLKVGYWPARIDDEVTSRASDTDMQEALDRLGAALVDVDFRKLLSTVQETLKLLRTKP